MSSKHRRASILCLALVLGACTTATTAAPSGSAPPPSSVALGTLTPTAIVATPSPAVSSAGTASPTDSGGGAQQSPSSIDPCSLLTADEASTLMGKKLGAGVSTLVDQDRECTFKSGLTEVKVILAPPAPDAATAQAYWDTERAQAPADIAIKDFKLFDRAAYGASSTGGISLSALFVIKGTSFFDLYCGFPGCSETASATAAQLIGDRLP